MLSSWNSSSMTSTLRKDILGTGSRRASSGLQREEDGRSRASSVDLGQPRAAAALSTIPSSPFGYDDYEGMATAGMMGWSEGEEHEHEQEQEKEEEEEEEEEEEGQEQQAASQLGRYPVVGAASARRQLMKSPSLPTNSGL
jgi:hypothetical protein